MQVTISTVCLSHTHHFHSSISMSRTPLIPMYYFLLPLIIHLFCPSFLSFISFLLLGHFNFLAFTKVMNKFNKPELLVLFVLALLLGVTPLLPSSLRPTYLYFIFNVLIIALGAEAGLLTVFAKPLEDKKQHVSVTQKPVIPQEVYEPEERVEAEASEHDEKKPKVVAKSASDEKIVGVTEVKKCPSMPNLLLIGGGESEGDVIEAEDEVGGVNGQELFAKAEAFIGNFYKQLKMQREDSWLYQEAFY